MKKSIVIILVIVQVMLATACGGTKAPAGSGKAGVQKTVSVNSIEELEEIVTADVENTITSLRSEYEALTTEIDTFDKYTKNIDKVTSFYGKIETENEQVLIRMREYAGCYVELILQSDDPNDEKYDKLEDLYDHIYDDALGDIYDGIYDDLLGDMYDSFYSGVVSDGYDYVSYRDWSDMSSDEYDKWSDSMSCVYRDWSDASRDIYRFWSDESSAFWNNDTEKAKEKLEKFREDIKTLKDKE